MKNDLFAIPMIGICMASIGCGSKSIAGRDPVYPVSGKVIYKGEPVTGADLTFLSEGKKRSAFARTDEQGRFRLTTFAPNDGAVAGKQFVLVRKVEPATEAAEKEPDIKDPSYDPFKVAANAAKAAKAKPKNQIPSKYADEKSTDLIAVVTAEKNPELVLELKD